MSTKWFYTRDNKTKLGPVSFARLQGLAESGQLRTTDMVQQAGVPRWTPAGEIAGLFSLSGASTAEPVRPKKGMGRGKVMVGPGASESPMIGKIKNLLVAAIVTVLLLSLGYGVFRLLAHDRRDAIAQRPEGNTKSVKSEASGDKKPEVKSEASGDKKPEVNSEASGDKKLVTAPNKTERWTHLDLGEEKEVDGFIRIRPQSFIQTKEAFTGPINITVVARTEKNSVRLSAFNGACVIFNWEDDPNELRVTRPDGNLKSESGTLVTARVRPLGANTWYILVWRITEDGMDVSVDGKVIFSEKKKYDLSAKRPVTVASGNNVDVKSFDVVKSDSSPNESPSQDKPEKNPVESGTSQIIAEGVGATGDEALRDAFRNAVRQVVGAVVDAETLVKNDEIISDKVLTYSDGFVKTYEEISKKQDKGLFRTKIKATVERRSVIAKLKAANITVKDVDGKGIFAEAVTQLDAEKDAKELLKKALDGFPNDNLLEAEVQGTPKITKQSDSGAMLEFKMLVKANTKAYDAFSSKLIAVLEKIAKEQGKFQWIGKGRLVPEIPTIGFIDKAGNPIPDKPVVIIINTVNNQGGDRTDWRYFVLDKSTRPAIARILKVVHSLNLQLTDSEGSQIASDKFKLESFDTGNAPKRFVSLVYPGAGRVRDYREGPLGEKEGLFLISPFFFGGQYRESTSGKAGWAGPYFNYYTQLEVTRTISLSLTEIKRIDKIKCELTH